MWILLVVSIAAVSGAVAIPIGSALGLKPLIVYVAAATTATGVTWFLLMGGHRMRSIATDRFGHDEHSVQRTNDFVDRYGTIGFGLVVPVFPGVIVSVLSGIALGIESKHLGRWMTFGITVWFGIFTAVSAGIRDGLIG